MSTTNGNMKTLRVTDKNGNVYILVPVDTVAQTAAANALTTAQSLNADSVKYKNIISDPNLGVYDATVAYVVGDFCYYENELYECNTAIASPGETWNSAHWTKIIVKDLIDAAKTIAEGAAQEIDDAKDLEFDEDFFTAEETDESVNIGLNGIPIGVEDNTPLEIAQDDENGLVLTSRALFGKAFCSEYNATSGTYSVGDYVIYQGKIYKCKTAIGTAEDFTASKWQEVVFIDYDLNDAPAFSTSSTYAVGKYCHYDGKLWVCTTTVSTSGAWDSSKWAEVERYVPDSISAALAQLADYVTKLAMAENFNGTHTYLTGDYCYYEGNLYRSKNDDAKPNFVSNQWIQVGEVLPDLLSRLTAYVRKYDLAEEYDERGIYAVGDYCYHNGSLYRCIHAKDSATLMVWVDNYWELVPEIMKEINSKINNKLVDYVTKLSLAAEFDNTNTDYAVGDYCYKDGTLYKSNIAQVHPVSWVALNWSQVDNLLPDLLSRISAVTTLRVGSGAPSVIASDEVGKMYLDTTNYDIYQCTLSNGSLTWGSPLCNIKGPAGQDGTDGTDGIDGATWFSGTVVSGTQAHVDGARVDDYYLNTSTGNVYRCVTTDTWSLVCNIHGSDGIGITSVTNTWVSDSQGTTTPQSGWSSVPSPTPGEYLWSRFDILLSDDNHQYFYNVVYIPQVQAVVIDGPQQNYDTDVLYLI